MHTQIGRPGHRQTGVGRTQIERAVKGDNSEDREGAISVDADDFVK